MMLALLSLGGCLVEKVPDLFDYRYDRVRVVAVRVWPLMADAAVPRQVDALVLTPRAEASPPVRVEVCGDRGDLAVWLGSFDSVQCFAETDLVDTVARQLPATWSPRERRYEDCPTQEMGQPTGVIQTFPEDTGDTAEPVFYPCVSSPMVRVVAGRELDEASAVVVPRLTDGDGPVAGPDPATADPRIEVVEGEVVPGGLVLLRFSVAASWTAEEGNAVDEYPEHYWYVEAGTPWGSGVTRGAGFDDEGRAYAQSWLEIPRDHRGPLRVAVVRRDPVPVWTEITLEVR
jgi:hypothetical protein